MKKIIGKRGRLSVLIVTSVLVFISIILFFQVNTNYDMTEYLPEDSGTIQGLEVLEDTFGNYAMVELMVKDVEFSEAQQIKGEIQAIEGVNQVVWLSDKADIRDPDSIDPELMSTYYNNGHALFTVIFAEDNYALEVEESIEAIRLALDDEEVYVRGQAVDNIESRNIAEGELIDLILIILPVCIIVLLFASMSWIEPLIVLTVLGIGVLVNLGTNAFLPSVSFITLTIAAALQLAISLDYSLFFIHRYYEFKDKGDKTFTAVNKAFKKAFPVITASAMTTIAGFLALLFMRYGIGLDIGIVLSKGILFSYLSVIFVLPVFIMVFDKLLQKTRHRTFMFHLGGMKKFSIKFRYAIAGLAVIVLGMGLFFQTQTEYIFGAGGYAGNDSEIALERQEIGEHFNEYETINLLLNNSDKTKELALIDLLEDTENVIEVDALYTAVPPNTPESSIPEEAIQGYNQNGYTRMTIYTDLVEESNAMFEFNETIDSLVDSQYEEYYMLGIISSTYEIRDTVLEDTPIVLLVSALMIGLVLVVVFKNLFVAVLLILVIQTAIWFNVGLLAINGKEVIYIGYLVVLALQLGATIDYAVLFASRYIEARHTVDKGEALGYSLKKSSIPIMISGIILAAAGFAEMLFSKITVVSDIGLLIGRGALLSLGMVLFFLPSIIYITDKWFVRKKIRNKLN